MELIEAKSKIEAAGGTAHIEDEVAVEGELNGQAVAYEEEIGWMLDERMVTEADIFGGQPDAKYWIAEGNTYQHKEELKRSGCRFEGPGVVGGCYWYWPHAEEPPAVESITWKPIE